jgi:hypothetical protein
MLSLKESGMGQAKKEMMRLEELEGAAMGVLAKTGAVKQCEIHDGIFIDQYDSDAMRQAYAVGTNMVKAGEVDATREEFMDAIKSASENAADECYICAKYRDE